MTNKQKLLNYIKKRGIKILLKDFEESKKYSDPFMSFLCYECDKQVKLKKKE
jgi:ferritin